VPIPINEFPCVPTLKYDEARSQIRSGDILMCSGTSDFSHLIQKATGSIWSHVGFILKIDKIDRIIVMESVESIGVRAVALSHYTHDYEGENKPYPGKILIARHSDFDESKIDHLSKKAIDLLGHQYSKQEIIKIAARVGLYGLIGNKDKCEIPEEGNDYICSEYGYVCYNSIGVYIEHDCRGFVTPADFAKTEEVNAVFWLN
jgi:hypothetical protein